MNLVVEEHSLENSDFLVIEGGSGEIVEKKSRFIANVKGVESEEEAALFIAEMKRRYWDARHNCMAYVIGDKKRFSDDGEPSGTAGKPILDVIEGNDIKNAVIVVTRYFGGVLLGTGGLVRAYKNAASEGIKNSVVAQKMTGICKEVKAEYNDFGKIQHMMEQKNIVITEIKYEEKVIFKYICGNESIEEISKKIDDLTAGRSKELDSQKIEYYKTETGIQLI